MFFFKTVLAHCKHQVRKVGVMIIKNSYEPHTTHIYVAFLQMDVVNPQGLNVS